MSSSLPVDGLILAGALLVIVGVLAGALAERTRAPGLLLFLAAGMAIGDDGLALIRFDDAQLAQTIGVIALVVILFEGGLTIDPSDLRAVAWPAALLASLGTFVTAGVVAVAVHELLGVSWPTSLIIGAVVGSTDAAAVFSAVRQVPMPRRLVSLLEAESGVNDPTAVVLTVAALAWWEGSVSAVEVAWFGVWQLAGGILAGVAVGLGGAELMRRLRLGSATLSPLLALAVGGAAYGTATGVGASGFLATYLAGIAVAQRVRRHQRTILRFSEGLAAWAQIALFLMLGLLVFPSRLPEVTVQALAVSAVLALVARPLAVVACTAWAGPGWRQLTLVSWAGLRGAVPIVLATFPLVAGHPDGELIFDVVFFVVLLSTLAQGLTIPALVRHLGLGGDPPRGGLLEVIELDDVELDLVELEVRGGPGLAGRMIAEVPPPAGARISVVLRGDTQLVPTGATTISAGDVLVVAVPRSDDAIDRVLAWADHPDGPGSAHQVPS